jgi:nucleoid-associated protein YgaU
MFKRLLIIPLGLTLYSCSIKLENKQDKVSELGHHTNTQVEDIIINLDEDFDYKISNYRSLSSVTVDNIHQDPKKAQEINDRLAKVSTFNTASKFSNYTVLENDTLMIIAFKLYGDTTKWRELAKSNNINEEDQVISTGQVLTYEVPSDPFIWKPLGKPHLIRKGDTLQKVSFKKYNTNREWRYIWDNNKILIKNPNLIFAGFTVYYLPLEKKEILTKVLNDRYLYIDKHSALLTKK